MCALPGGTVQMHRILERVTNGSATTMDLARLEELCTDGGRDQPVRLGQSAPNPVLSTLRYFREEYEAHIHHRTCTAAVCEFDQVPMLELV